MARTISTTSSTGITLTSAADNPVTVTGRISVTSGTALTGASGAANNWTVVNSGTIITTANSTGVFLGSYVGTIATGSVTNQSGGLISATGYGIFINAKTSASVTNLSGGTISAHNFKAVYISGGPGTVVNGGVMLAGNVGVYEYLGGTVTNLSTGTITGAGGVWFQQPGTFTNFGVVVGTNTGFGSVTFNSNAGSSRLIVEPGASFSGKIQSLAASTNVVELASSASTGTLAGFDGTTITNFATLQFDAGAKWKVTGNTLASGLGTIAITGFTANDTIDLTGFVAVSDTFASNALVLTNAGGGHATLHVQGVFSSGDFQLSSDLGTGTNIIVCFASGTRIATPAGGVPIEELVSGDLVRTHFTGSAPVQRISRRHVDCARHPEPRNAWPVRVSADAFGPGRPDRDLFLSPNHGIYVNGDLFPARCLINGTSIVQVPVNEITYYHVELAQHDLLSAEGLLTESYLDAGDRSNFADGPEPMRLFPDFATCPVDAAALWETKGCASLILRGPRLEAARSWVNGLVGADVQVAAAA